MHTLTSLLAVFFERHWLVAITNAVLTALLGLGLLGWARKWRALKLSPLDCLRLRRFVLLCALYKGALFLLLGLSFNRMRQFPLVYGIQIPDPRDVLLLAPIGPLSIWHPTSASKVVSLLLVGGATLFLIRRGIQFIRSTRALRTLLHLGGSTESTNKILKQAATALGLSDVQGLPAIVLVDVPYPTPMLVGLRRPYILLAPQLVHRLSEAELEMALRHELAHFQRRDHWWRWLFTWLEDVGRLNLLSGQLGVLALDSEEELCDRMAVRTPQEALTLASAIRTSVAFYQDALPQEALPQEALPTAASVSRGDTDGRESSKLITLLGTTAHGDEAPSSQPSSFPQLSSGEAQSSEDTEGLRSASPSKSPLALSTASSTGSLHADDDPILPPKDLILPSFILPSAVLPALLGRHTKKWSQPSVLNRRLRGLLAAAQEISAAQEVSVQQVAASGNPAALTRDRNHQSGATVATVLQMATRVGFGILLFLIIYIKFYVVLDLSAPGLR